MFPTNEVNDSNLTEINQVQHKQDLTLGQPSVSVLLAIDHLLFRQGVRLTLAKSGGFEVVAETGDGREALELAERLLPDVLLIGQKLPTGQGLDGLKVCRILRRRLPHTAVVILSEQVAEAGQMYEALQAGAAAYVATSISLQELVQLVRAVAQGAYPINDLVLEQPQVARRVLSQFQTLTQSRDVAALGSLYEPLTNRELQILENVAKGHTNKEIGKLLDISNQTVKNHITSILRKLSANDRTQAVMIALQQGWLKLE